MTVQKQIETKKNFRKFLHSKEQIYLEKYKTAPAPSRDYYGLKITYTKIIIHHWRISHGPIKCPGYQEYTFEDYLTCRSAQHDVLRVFGSQIAEQTSEFAKFGGKRLDMLPENVMHLLTKFLGYKEVCRMSQTSKNLYKMLQSDQVWKPLFRTYFRNFATKEELKLAKCGGWRAWCKKVKLSLRERNADITLPKKPTKAVTILPIVENKFIDCHGDAAKPRSSLLPNSPTPVDVNYHPFATKSKRSGTIYPTSVKSNSPRSTMRVSKRYMSTSNSLYSPKKGSSSGKSSPKDKSPRKDKDKKVMTMYLNLLETKSAPIVIRQEEEYIKPKRPSKFSPHNRTAPGMHYRLPVPKALHHPKYRETPLPDIVNDSPRESPKRPERIMLPRHKIPMPLMKPIKKNFAEKYKQNPPNQPPPKEPEVVKTKEKKTADDTKKEKEKKSEIPVSTAASLRKEIKSIEDLNVETLYTKNEIKNIKISENHSIFAPNMSSLPQRSLLQGISDKWSLKRDKSFLDSNSMLLLEGRLPIGLDNYKNMNYNLPAKTSEDDKSIDSFGSIRKKLDDSLKQDKEMDEFFDNYVKNIFPSRLNKSSVSLKSPNNEGKKTGPDKTNQTVRKDIQVRKADSTKTASKSIVKKQIPVKDMIKSKVEKSEVIKKTKETSSGQNAQRQLKMAKGAVYALAAANDNESQTIKRNPSQKYYMDKQNIRMETVRPMATKRNLESSKSSPTLFNQQDRQRFINQSNLHKVTNEALARYPRKSKMESLIDFGNSLKQKHSELCVKSPINIRSGKSTTCVTKKTPKPSDQ